MSLRVVHVLDSLRLGGTETQCVALVHALAARGVASHLVHFQGGPLATGLTVPGVTTEHVPVAGFRQPGFARLVLRLASAIRRSRADVVQSYEFYSNVPAMLAGRLAGARVLVASRRGFATSLRPGQRRADRLARRLARRTVVNAQAIRRQLIEDDRARPDDVVVIPNCVRERGAVTPAQDPVVGMVANFRPPKDHATFLRAAARVVELVPTVEFHLVGAGPAEAAARRQAAELGLAARVRFLGALGPDATWTAMNRFTVAVLSSLSEGMPNAVLEAMVAARPVVATAVGGIPEVVRDGVTGCLVAAGDAAGLAAGLGRILKDPALATAMGAAGRRQALAAHAPARMAERFLALYAALGARGALA
jgi:glycosyltransferase involved in cell wall biosynthesis